MKTVKWLMALLVLALAGCESYTFGDEGDCDADWQLVVEGWIDHKGYPVVILTRTVTPSEKPVPISDCLVRWGKVTISDGVNTSVMAGGPDNKTFPRYAYTCYDFAGEVGKTYTIEAEYEGHTVRASSVMLPPPEIVGIEIEGEATDTLLSAVVSFRQHDAGTGYYVAFVRDMERDLTMLPAMMGAIEVTGGEEHIHRLQLRRGISKITDVDYESRFVRGDVVDMVLARVEKQVFDFYRLYGETIMLGNSLFLNVNGSLDSNVEGGYGIWSARGGSPLRFVAE